MKIYELPYEIRKRVYQLQVESGNRPNAQIELMAKAADGNFDWHKTRENFFMWKNVNEGRFKSFYNKNPNPDPGSFDLPNLQGFTWNVADRVIKECPINLSEHAQDDLKETIVRVFDVLNLGALFSNRIEIIDGYKSAMRERAQQIINNFDSKYPGGLMTKEPDGQVVGLNVAFKKWVSEFIDLGIDEFIRVYVDRCSAPMPHSVTWLRETLQIAISNVGKEK